MQWDYDCIMSPTLEGLKEMGKAGWELVCIIPGPEGKWLFYFKRRLPR